MGRFWRKMAERPRFFDTKSVGVTDYFGSGDNCRSRGPNCGHNLAGGH